MLIGVLDLLASSLFDAVIYNFEDERVLIEKNKLDLIKKVMNIHSKDILSLSTAVKKYG